LKDLVTAWRSVRPSLCRVLHPVAFGYGCQLLYRVCVIWDLDSINQLTRQVCHNTGHLVNTGPMRGTSTGWMHISWWTVRRNGRWCCWHEKVINCLPIQREEKLRTYIWKRQKENPMPTAKAGAHCRVPVPCPHPRHGGRRGRQGQARPMGASEAGGGRRDRWGQARLVGAGEANWGRKPPGQTPSQQLYCITIRSGKIQPPNSVQSNPELSGVLGNFRPLSSVTR